MPIFSQKTVASGDGFSRSEYQLGDSIVHLPVSHSVCLSISLSIY